MSDDSLRYLRDQAASHRSMAAWHRKSAAEYDVKAADMQRAADDMEAALKIKTIDVRSNTGQIIEVQL